VFVHEGRALPLDAPGHDDIANIGFIVGTRCVAVIDSGGSVAIGRALLASVRSHTPLPVCYLINTHVHVDHLLGNYAFAAERPQFVGHAQLPAALTRSREFFLGHYAADLEPPATAAQLIGPGRTVATGSDVEVDLGGRHLTLRAWPVAHTDCDLTVLDSRTGTLWTGDLLFVGRTPVLDGSLKGWLAALDGLARLNVQHVVPGHGPPGDDLQRALGPQRHYLETLLEVVRAQLARGVTLPQALRTGDFPGRGDWLLFDETHPHNLARAYQELEWE
jgi:quinoprotein relay system zinc metallohydrolase 2